MFANTSLPFPALLGKTCGKAHGVVLASPCVARLAREERIMPAKTTSTTCKRLPDDRPHVILRTDWHRAARRLIVGGLCAVTVASLAFPSAALAAEWVNVGGTQYDAAAGDETGTWSWDGANDMRLNGYDGGSIEAAGRLDLTYEGDNTVTNNDGEGISVVNGANENAELNITGGAGDSLTVDATQDAIESQGDINISGDGTITSTASRADGIDAEGNLSISGGGTVTAIGSSDGIEVGGNATIDTSGSVTAKGANANGLDVNGNLTVSGGGAVTANSEYDAAVDVDGDLGISGGSRLNASSVHDTGVEVGGSLTMFGGGSLAASSVEGRGANVEGNLTMTGGSRLEASSGQRTGLLVEGALSAVDSTIVASGTWEGLYVYEDVTFDHATVKVTACSAGGDAYGLFADEGDIVIKNGSLVDALAEGEYSAGILARNYEEGGAGGHVFISDSVVKAIARYLAEEGQDGGDISINSVDGADAENGDEQLGENIGILVLTEDGISPAKLSIVRSTVTAEGDTAAILVYAVSDDGSVAGTIELEGSLVQTPAGGRVSDYNVKGEGMDGVEYDVGQTIGLSGAPIDSLSSADIVKSAVIAPQVNPEPANPGASGATGGVTVTRAAVRTATKAGSSIPQTGDATPAGIVAAGLAGLTALASGLFVSRRRS